MNELEETEFQTDQLYGLFCDTGFLFALIKYAVYIMFNGDLTVSELFWKTQLFICLQWIPKNLIKC